MIFLIGQQYNLKDTTKIMNESVCESSDFWGLIKTTTYNSS